MRREVWGEVSFSNSFCSLHERFFLPLQKFFFAESRDSYPTPFAQRNFCVFSLSVEHRGIWVDTVTVWAS